MCKHIIIMNNLKEIHCRISNGSDAAVSECTYGGTVTGSRFGAGGFCLATNLAWMSQYNLLFML